MKIFYKLTKRSILLAALAIPLPFAGLAAPEQRPASLTESLAAEKHPVDGIVLDESGNPMAGATVVGEDGSSAVSDSEGRFRLMMNDPSKPLTIRFIGYEPVVVVPGSRTQLEIKLRTDAQRVDDVVVIGYGSRDRSSLTSSISSLRQEDVAVMAPVASSLQDLIGGSVKGVMVSQSTGAPGAVTKINIRGITSPYPNSTTGISNNTPLYVIDGVAQFVDDTQSINPLQALSPNDIESIDVLKDASATAIYGSRGANGVIIVKTKSGRQGEQASVEFGYTLSIANPVKTYKPLNNAEYLNLQSEALQGTAAAMKEYVNYGTQILVPFYFTDIIQNYGNFDADYNFLGLNTSRYGKASTDWDDEVRNHNAVSHSYRAAVRGGAERSDYSLSFNAINQQGLYLQDNMDTYNGRIQANTEVLRGIRVGGVMNYSYSEHRTSQQDELYGPTRNYKYAPDVEPYDESGNPNRIDASMTQMLMGATDPSPVGLLALKNISEASSFSASAYTDIDLYRSGSHDLKFRADINASIYDSKGSSLMPQSTMPQFPIEGYDLPSTLGISQSRTTNTSVNFRLDYDFSSGRHALQAMLGYGSDRNHTTGSSQNYAGMADEEIMTQPSAAQEYQGGVDVSYRGGLNSIYSRVSYDYAKRYFVDLSLRADESSKFGINNRWGFFPALSTGWMISNEPFMASVRNIDQLKLRLSWGMTGSTNVPDFAYIQYYEIGSGVNGGNIYGDHSTIVLKNFLPNPDLRWEMTSEWNAGLDFSFFNGRLFGSVDAYYRYTDGALAPAPHILESGMSQYFDNIIDMSNRGVEISLGGDIVRSKDFLWTSVLNLSLNRNRVERLNSAQLSSTYQDTFIEGMPVGVVKGYLVEGIAQSMDRVQELNAAAVEKGFSSYQSNVLGVGDYIMCDTNNDGHVSSDDRVVVANPEAKFFGGWNNRFQYRNLSLSMMFQYSYGAEAVYSAALNDIASAFGQSVTREVYGNTWTPERTDARFPRLVAMGYSLNSMISDRYVYDASYLRLKNLTLSYALPKTWAQRIHAGDISVFFTATNLFTITSWPGIDPETLGAAVFDMGENNDPYPLARTFSFGVNLTF